MEITIIISALIGCAIVSFVIWTLFTTGEKSYDQAIAEQQQYELAQTTSKGSKKNRSIKHIKRKKKNDSGDESSLTHASLDQQQSTSVSHSNNESGHSVVQASNQNDHNSNDIKSKTNEKVTVANEKQKHTANKTKDTTAKQDHSSKKSGKTGLSSTITANGEVKKTSVKSDKNPSASVIKSQQKVPTESKQTTGSKIADVNQTTNAKSLDDGKSASEVRNKRSLPTEQKLSQSNKRKKTTRQGEGATANDIVKRLDSSTFTEEEIQLVIDHLLEKQSDGTWQKSSVKGAGIVSIRKQLQIKEAELTQEKESNRNFLKQIKDIRNQLSEERVKRDSLYNKANNKIAAQVKEIAELKEQLLALRQKTSPKKLPDQIPNDLEQLQTTNKQLNESLKSSNQKLNDILQESTQKDNTLRRCQDKIRSLEQQLDKYKSDKAEKPHVSGNKTLEYITAFKDELVQCANELHVAKLVPLTKALIPQTEDEEIVIKRLHEIAEAVSTSISKFQVISKSSKTIGDRCEVIRNDIVNQKSNIATITKTVEGLLSKLDVFEKEKDKSIKNLNEEIKRSTITRQDSERKQKELQKKCEELQKIITEKENTLQNLQTNIRENAHSAENNNTDNANKDNAMDALRSELDEIKKKLKESTLKLGNLSKDKDQLLQQNNLLLQQEATTQEAYNNMQTDIKNRDLTIKSLEEALSQKTNSINDLQKSTEKVITEKDQKITVLESEIKAKEKSISDLRHNITNNDAQLKKVEDKLQQVHTVTKAHLKNSFPEVKEDASLDITNWTVHFGNGVKNFCDNITSKATQMEKKLRAEVDNYQKLLKTSSDNEANLKNQIAQLNKEKENEIKQQATSNKSTEILQETLKIEVQKLKDDIKQEKDKCHRYELNMKEISDKLENSLKELDKEHSRNNDLTANSKKLEIAVAESQDKTGKLRVELKQLQTELAKTGSTANKYNQDLIAERVAASKLKEKLTKLEKNNDDMQDVRKELDEVKSKLSSADTILDQKSKALTARDEAYRSLEAQHSKLADDLAKTKRELAEKITNAKHVGSTKRIPAKSPVKSPALVKSPAPVKSPAKDDTAV